MLERIIFCIIGVFLILTFYSMYKYFICEIWDELISTFGSISKPLDNCLKTTTSIMLRGKQLNGLFFVYFYQDYLLIRKVFSKGVFVKIAYKKLRASKKHTLTFKIFIVDGKGVEIGFDKTSLFLLKRKTGIFL